MSLSLPADPSSARSLTDVAREAMAALGGRSQWFGPATSTIVFVIDGLGAANLGARSGHARFLSAHRGKKDVARSVFPSTTAAALTSLLTGTAPGRHGIVGYRTRVPGTGIVANQLRGWEAGELPDDWQRAEPLTATRRSFVVTRPEYVGSGFTRATVGDADVEAVSALEERAARAAELAARHPGSFVYLYAPDLDAIGHKHGWESDAWTAALERVDAVVRDLARDISPTTGLIVTADHGMIDVPRHRHVLLGEGDELLTDVEDVGGEPRMLHLYTAPGTAADVARRWRDAESSRAWVMTRDEAIASRLFGPVDAAVAPRIGDVLIAARSAIAYYDDRLHDKAPQRMVGQHGSLTSEERIVPLVRLGAFA